MNDNIFIYFCLITKPRGLLSHKNIKIFCSAFYDLNKSGRLEILDFYGYWWYLVTQPSFLHPSIHPSTGSLKAPLEDLKPLKGEISKPERELHFEIRKMHHK